MIGDRNLLKLFPEDAPLKAPDGIDSDGLPSLIPYYDALQETEAVFLFGEDGKLFGIKRLLRIKDGSGGLQLMTGIELLKWATGKHPATGLVVYRGRKAIAVYRESRLEGVAELSEKTGTWEFTQPAPILEDIESMIPGIKEPLEIVFEISWDMITRGYGGLFVVGDVPKKLKYGNPKIIVNEKEIEHLEIGMVSEIAKLDGAVFVSKEGILQKASVIIINSPDSDKIFKASGYSTARDIGGSRRKTAYLTSIECWEAAVVCVSQNRSIEIWVRGASMPVFEAITGMSRQ